MKKIIKESLFTAVILALVLAPFVYICESSEPITSVGAQSDNDIRWKDEDAAIEEDVHIEEIEVETVTKSYVEEVKFYNVPLSEEIQLHIFKECEKHNIAPALVIALIERESSFDANEKSRNGAIGLMQVVPKWHEDRMSRLDCNDLYDPFQNITVGIDYLSELKAKNDDLYWVLMAYNMGENKATEKQNNDEVTFYAIKIVERAVKIEVENATK